VTYKKITSGKPVQLILFCLGSFLLFFPNLTRPFASDDFLVMKRVGLDKVIFIKGFFRPLSDITLYFNYFIGGFDPVGYYALNIVMHGVNSFLLFRFCLQWRWTNDENSQRKYAILSALLFLCYPFHNESIVWVLGRASLVANLFGMAALVSVVSGLSLRKKIFWACLCYFIGMSGYESVLLLPLMVLVILYSRRNTLRKEYLYWGAALGMTLLAHLIIRVLVSGGVMGEYGTAFWGSRLLQYLGNLFKLTGRMFLPPMENSRLLVLLFVALTAGLSGVIFFFWRRYREQAAIKGYFGKLFMLLVIACAVPFLSGVSTRTSESDRFLYFPSYFLCCGISFLLINLVRERYRLYGWVLAILVYQVLFLELNTRNWLRAGGITKDILAAIVRQAPAKRVFVVNLPDEWEGAFIFRLGLPDALLMKGIDTSRLVIVSHLPRDLWLSLPDSIQPVRTGGEVRIGPDARIFRQGTDSFRISGTGDGEVLHESGQKSAEYWLAGKNDIFLYWNKKRLLTWVPTNEGP
jgi:protein O-mannosyl-transferase